MGQRNQPYKQDCVLLFTVNKDNCPIRREYLSHVTIIMQNGGLPAKITSLQKFPPSFKHGLYSVIFINMTFEMAITVDFDIISDQETIG